METKMKKRIAAITVIALAIAGPTTVLQAQGKEKTITTVVKIARI
jgi:hypothetical protein